MTKNYLAHSSPGSKLMRDLASLVGWLRALVLVSISFASGCGDISVPDVDETCQAYCVGQQAYACNAAGIVVAAQLCGADESCSVGACVPLGDVQDGFSGDDGDVSGDVFTDIGPDTGSDQGVDTTGNDDGVADTGSELPDIEQTDIIEDTADDAVDAVDAVDDGPDTTDISGGDMQSDALDVGPLDSLDDVEPTDIVNDGLADADLPNAEDTFGELGLDGAGDVSGDLLSDGATNDNGVDSGADGTDVGPDTTGLPCPPTVGSNVTRIDSISVPASPGCDANGDGVVNEDDGELNDLIQLLAASVVENSAEAVADGTLIVAVEYAGGAGGTPFVANFLDGVPLSGQPAASCITGTAGLDCDLTIDSASYDGQCSALSTVPDCVTGIQGLECGTGDVVFPIALGGMVVHLPLSSATLTGTIGLGSSLTDGRLCGEVLKTDFLDAIDASCDVPDPISFCTTTGLLGSLLSCGSDDLCTVTLSLNGVAPGEVDVEWP